MFRSLNTYIIIVFILTQCISNTKNVYEVNFSNNNLFFYIDTTNSDIPFHSFSTEHLNFRLDYKGISTSLKGSISYSIDSFIFVNLFTQIGTKIMEFVATENNILIVDIKGNLFYNISYNQLQNFLGVKINFNSIQYLLLGIPHYFFDYNLININSRSYSKLRKSVIFSFNQFGDSIPVVSSFYIFNTENNFLEKFELHLNNEIPISVSYKWKKSSNEFQIPRMVDLGFSFNNTSVDCLLEYKNPIFNTFVSHSIDTSSYKRILLHANE